jgi:hypothetical protein
MQAQGGAAERDTSADPRRQTPRPEVAPRAPVDGPLCTCGHGRQAHQHYRRGTDCALCACAGFRRPFLSRLRLRRR